MSSIHTADCTGIERTDDCEPVVGLWLQPDGYHVSEALDQLGEDPPWCQVHWLAFELQEVDH